MIVTVTSATMQKSYILKRKESIDFS